MSIYYGPGNGPKNNHLNNIISLSRKCYEENKQAKGIGND